ncbi:MAG: hypothetical protein MI922_18100, partial [Bacteroidales bacterium]|nr:hypothetical protein [Bacteroidales bacterium]
VLNNLLLLNLALSGKALLHQICWLFLSFLLIANAGFQWPPCKVFVFKNDLPGIWIFDFIDGRMAVHCKPLLGN